MYCPDELKTDRQGKRRIRLRTFEELWEEAEETLLADCRYHRFCEIWLVRPWVDMRGTYPANAKRILRDPTAVRLMGQTI